ncbi:MAG: polyribonucleotide nucleotidyltransferase [Candidatus Omnitrophica bacterium]|nr:polyribonucleotide nucleotidyltransferase [Candidatus Omnitrophota bacterium]
MSVSLSISNSERSPLTVSSGSWAKQASGSVTMSLGDSMVLATVCMSKEPKDIGFFPLFVDYQEKTYAMGKIPGGFYKKEGRPKDAEILTSRLIDRPIRPLFPKGFLNEIQVVATVLSSDGENDPDVVAINAVSAALLISDIPFNGPIAAVRIAKCGNDFVVNPTYKEREESLIDLVVVGSDKGVVMLEGGFDQTQESVVLEAVKFAKGHIEEIIKLQKDLQEKCAKPKKEVAAPIINEELVKFIEEKTLPRLKEKYGTSFKKEDADAQAKEHLDFLKGLLLVENPPVVIKSEKPESEIKSIFFEIEEAFVRERIVKDGKRPDGRGVDEIRQINCETSVLPRTHGSAVFTRGQTQALGIVTLGGASDAQTVESLEGRTSKRFMLHYSFPPFSVGEVKPMRGPSRRDIGHGTLAEKSVFKVLPDREEFPYTIRVCSEILESNGSSSMATVCAATLSLMDAGVPIKEPVAGIAMGLFCQKDEFKVLTDIAGVEDHCGDMDFKVAGTKQGIVAVQLDIKIDGITYEMIEETLACAKKARLSILDKMTEAISKPNEKLSLYAPKIKSFKIDPDKIGAVIGPGGKNIRRLSSENNVNIDIDDEAEKVFVVAQTDEDLERATKQILTLIRDIEVGDVYEAKVARIANFGAFCEIAPGKSGLVHVSEISDEYVKDVTSVLKEGDDVTVKVIGIDNQGRINLSIKQAK